MRFYFFALILVSLMFLLAAAGFNLPVSGGIVKQLGLMNEQGDATIEDVKSSDFWGEGGSLIDNSLKAILIGAVTAGIIVGIFGRAPDIAYIMAGLVFLLASAIVADYIAIFLIMKSFGVTWITWVGTMIFGGLIAGFFITAIDFWRGTD